MKIKTHSLSVVFFVTVAIIIPSVCHGTTPARYTGFGSCAVAVVEDLGAISLNPSGLIMMKENETGFGVNDIVHPYSYGIDYTFYYGGEVRGSFARGGRFGTSLSFGNRLQGAGDFSFLLGYAKIFTLARYGELPVGLSLGGASFVDEENPSARRIFKPNIVLGAQKDFPYKWLGGLSIKSIGGKTSVVLGAARRFYHDDYLAVMDIDTDSKIYLGCETGAWGNLARARAGIDTRQKAFTVGLGAYMWPYAADIYFLFPFDSSIPERLGCSFVYRFGGYDFSSKLLRENTEKAVYLERKIKKSKETLADLKKKLAETEIAVKKAKDFVDILDSEAAELIKKKLRLMKSQEDVPAAPPPKPQPSAIQKPREEPKRTWPVRHKIVRGDSIRSLAQYYYGDANKWQKIYEANSGKIERGLPKVGEEFIIPAP